MKYIIITKKIWSKTNFDSLKKNFLIFNKINTKKIKSLNPKIIFFIHWSKLINSSIFNNYTCIQFHASNLPKGRGGSPVQNQILMNKRKTKLSAFKVSKNLDAGPICLQNNLDLKGNANQIFIKLEKTAVLMIKKISRKKKLIFKSQKGSPSYFKRRNPKQSLIDFKKIRSFNKLYDFLRMLDADGYPKAYVKLNKYNFSFYSVKQNKKTIFANVLIKKR